MMNKSREFQTNLAFFPLQVLTRIGLFSNNKKSLSRVCKRFRAAVNSNVPTQDLLREVMDGNPLGVERLLRKFTGDCIVIQIMGIEANGRVWEKVSPLEFAAWAGDVELVQLLMSQVPKDETEKALSQLNKLELEGSEHGYPMLPFLILRNTYGSYREIYNSLSEQELSEGAVLKLGGAQRQLPVVGLQWYCDRVSFDKMKPIDFHREPSRSCEVIYGQNLITSGHVTFELGTSFFLVKDAFLTYPQCKGDFLIARDGEKAIDMLYHAKRYQLVELIYKLNNPGKPLPTCLGFNYDSNEKSRAYGSKPVVEMTGTLQL